MTDRERRLVRIAGGAVAALVLYAALLLVWRSIGSSTPSRDSLSGLRAQVERKEQVAERLAAVSERLSVRIPTSSGDDQVQAIVKNMEEIAKESNLKLTRFSPKPTGSVRGRDPRRAGAKVDFDLAFSTNHAGLIGLFEAMQKRGLPYEIQSFSVRANHQRPDALEVSLELGFYLLEPMMEAKPRAES